MDDTFTLTFTRPPVEDGTTNHDTVELISRLDPLDPDWKQKASMLIKRYVHHEKLSVYNRINEGLVKRIGDLKLLEEVLNTKVETHNQLYKQLTKELSI
jgi:hypothetical protein